MILRHLGLNYHVGFIVVNNDQILFAHSDYFSGKVQIEKAADSYALLTASVFVLGQVTPNASLMKKWVEVVRVY